jgi:ADP-ribose pyrophosphatase YjhB (NUDIX family)
VRVAGLIPSGDGLVLVRHVKGGESYHLLPGGGVEPGETIGAALSRELLEETGLVCEPVAPLFVSDSIAPDGGRHLIQITFLVRPVSGALVDVPADPRVAAAHAVPFSDLAALDLRPPMAAALLEAAANGYAGPARYLGPLWSATGTGITETGPTPVTDR